MKKTLLFLLMTFFAISLYAEQPKVKFYFGADSSKQYDLDDIFNIEIIKSQGDYNMKIYYSGQPAISYSTGKINKIEFGIDSDILIIYSDNIPNTYKMYFIDSILYIPNLFNPVTIGSQVWASRNLDVDHYRNSDPIPQVTDPTQWINLKTGAWCYYNNSDSLGAIYGKLYNWYAVNDSRGLAPEGWHVATDSEWTTLEDCLGGSAVAGGKLKEAGTSHWYSPNTGATNTSGFSAVPGGYRWVDGRFPDIGYHCYWWSATEDGGASSALFRNLYYRDAYVHRDILCKELGFSVRCVRD